MTGTGSTVATVGGNRVGFGGNGFGFREMDLDLGKWGICPHFFAVQDLRSPKMAAMTGLVLSWGCRGAVRSWLDPSGWIRPRSSWCFTSGHCLGPKAA